MKKFIILFFLLFGFVHFSHTQNNIFYVDGDGKLYWKKDVPITITISNGNNEYKLDKSFLLDTEGLNYLRSKWMVDSTGKYVLPKREVLWEIYADGEPPKTMVKYIADKNYTFRGNTYYSDDLKIELISNDKLSGVKEIYFNLDTTKFIEYKEPIFVGDMKNVKIAFYSIDNVGNVEEVQTINYEQDNNRLNFSIDNTPPVSKIVNEDTAFTKKDEIIINAVDDEAGVNAIYYSYDGVNFNIFGDGISLDTLKDGSYKLHYYSLDWINNIEDTKTFNFYVDSTPPEIVVEEELIERNLTHLRKITILAEDKMSGVKDVRVKIGNNDYKEYVEPFYIDVSQEKIIVISTDILGNHTYRTITYTIK